MDCGRWWWIYFGCRWEVVDGGGCILAGGGWWWVVVVDIQNLNIFLIKHRLTWIYIWIAIGGGGYIWLLVGDNGWWWIYRFYLFFVLNTILLGYILDCGGCWWIYFGYRWKVVVGSGSVLAVGKWWWMLVGGCG